MTMFTRIRIDPRRRTARHALASNERLHAIVQRATSPESHPTTDTNGRALWRLDPGHSTHALYIVSSGYVNAAVLQQQLGVSLTDIASCSYDPFLDQLSIGQQWRFRLKANPTKSIGSRKHGKRGQRIPITNQSEQIDWLERQASRLGFHIPINRLEVPEVIVRDSGPISFMRKERQVTLRSVIFDGFLAIDNPNQLRKALTDGIGRARGYGFGLMTLVPTTISDEARGKTTTCNEG